MSSPDVGPSQLPDSENLEALAACLDEKTRHWSGGWERTPEYRQVIQLGEQVLSPLLNDIAEIGIENRRQGRRIWWRITVIGAIAHELGKPIQVRDEKQGVQAFVGEAVLAWGKEQGYWEPKSTGEA